MRVRQCSTAGGNIGAMARLRLRLVSRWTSSVGFLPTCRALRAGRSLFYQTLASGHTLRSAELRLVALSEMSP